MPDAVPLPLLFLGLFTFGSVLVGTCLWVRESTPREVDVLFHVKPLAMRWYGVVLCGGAFFVIPLLFRLTGVLRRISGNEIECSFYAGFAVECALVLFFVAITAGSEKIRDGLCKGGFSIRLCICEFLNVAIGCSAVILAPICEEIFFRGILLRFFCSFLSLPKSLWLSSFVFAAMHGSWAAFLPIAAVGYRLGRSYAESRNLAVNMTIHGLFNAFNFTLAVTYAHCYVA